ncbi:MAG: N-acetyltransferase [Bacteroidetes bacterium]|nr:N-acetyltransferase [Bacteroidota bacterium]
MIHPSAEVLTDQIGSGTIIWQNVVVLGDAKIGNNCNINCNCFIENNVVIGNNVTLKIGVSVWDNTIIEDDVFIGPNATFANDLVPRSKTYPDNFLKTVIEKGASLGANSTIIGGNRIGRYALIGAGSVITKSIPPFTVWYGNPAVHRGYISKDGTMLNMDLVSDQGIQYVREDDEPVISK